MPCFALENSRASRAPAHAHEPLWPVQYAVDEAFVRREQVLVIQVLNPLRIVRTVSAPGACVVLSLWLASEYGA